VVDIGGGWMMARQELAAAPMSNRCGTGAKVGRPACGVLEQIDIREPKPCGAGVSSVQPFYSHLADAAMSSDAIDISAVRSKFPALALDQVFFDNAGGSQTLKAVVDS
jgi:hypothetical protein